MKGKVLSVRISVNDLANCVELCNSVNAHPLGMSGYVAKSLALLMENLRQSNKLLNFSEQQAEQVLKETFGDREVGQSCELPLDFASLPGLDKQLRHVENARSGVAQFRESYLQQPKVPEAAFDGLTEEHIEMAGYGASHTLDAETQFDQELEEEMRLSALLEGEKLIDALLVTKHRRDDSEVELMQPQTKVLETKVEEEKKD